jgi:predicted anti-sigma-YlaC factor YlaD
MMSRRLRGWLFRYVPLMISCREVDEFLVDYFEGSLTPRQRLVFELHLLVCRDCHAYLERYRRAIELGQRTLRDEVSLPPEIPTDLVNAILASRRDEIDREG